MNIMDKVLNEIETNDLDEQVRQLCDKIQKEEDQTTTLEYDQDENIIRPDGPNIFLTIPCNGQLRNQKGYLTLERDFPEEFFVGLWSKNSNDQYQRVKYWAIREGKPKKIIKEYGKILKLFGKVE